MQNYTLVPPEESDELEDDFLTTFFNGGFVTFGCTSSELSESDELGLGAAFLTGFEVGTTFCTTFCFFVTFGSSSSELSDSDELEGTFFNFAGVIFFELFGASFAEISAFSRFGVANIFSSDESEELEGARFTTTFVF